MNPSPTDPLPDPRAGDSVAATGAEEGGPVLGYAARPAGARRLWRWIRPGSVLFFVLVAGLAAGAGWGVWNWRLAADRKAFEGCATIYNGGPGGSDVTFTHAPSRGALRHLSRLPAMVDVTMEWPENENAAAAEAFGAANLGNVSAIVMRDEVNADLLLKSLARNDSGLKALTKLYLCNTNVTDAGLKELTRPHSGLKALTGLYLFNKDVTGAGLKGLVQPDSGHPAQTTLDLRPTKVTNTGVEALQAARPGLTIVR